MKSSDPLFAVMLMCKESEGDKQEKSFVRMVTGAPEPMTVLAYDWSLEDIQRFCTQQQCTVLSVDPTFNLGDFDVTVTTYRHLLLKNASGHHPVMIGPVFVHQRKRFETHHFFASALTGLKPALTQLRSFGTDGEKALSNAFGTVFSQAVHLRCFLHFRGNLEAKLREYGIPKHIQVEFLRDVFGDHSKCEDGLVDAETDDFDAIVDSLETVWNEREKPHHNPPEFFQWFVKYCKEEVRVTMLKDQRIKVGLGDPPQPFYTNDVESLNNVIKHQTQYKAQQLPEFIASVKSLLDSQRKEIERACACMGEYRLVEGYKDLTVETRKFFLMSQKQREKKVNALFTSSLRDIYECSNDPVINEDLSVESAIQRENPLMKLSIPDYLAKKLWVESSELLESDDSVCCSPGCRDGTQWLVESVGSSRKSPFFVEIAPNGQVKCEQSCGVYKSTKICKHIVAVARYTCSLDSLVSWLSKQKGGTLNITKLASVDMPVGSPKRKASSKQSSKRLKLIVEDSSQPHTYRVQPAKQLDSPFVTDESLEEEPSEEPHVPCSRPSLGSPPPLIPSTQIANVSLPYSPVVFAPLIVPTATNIMSPCTSKVDSPFWLTFVKGNISRCAGCDKRNLRGEDGKRHEAPHDLCVQHKEQVMFQNPRSGNYQLSKDLRNVYYHANKLCVMAKSPNFNPLTDLKVSKDVRARLTSAHLQLLLDQFGLSFLNSLSS